MNNQQSECVAKIIITAGTVCYIMNNVTFPEHAGVKLSMPMQSRKK